MAHLSNECSAAVGTGDANGFVQEGVGVTADDEIDAWNLRRDGEVVGCGGAASAGVLMAEMAEADHKIAFVEGSEAFGHIAGAGDGVVHRHGTVQGLRNHPFETNAEPKDADPYRSAPDDG